MNRELQIQIFENIYTLSGLPNVDVHIIMHTSLQKDVLWQLAISTIT
jgi:hypothetical protein